MKLGCWLVVALLSSPAAQSQEVEKVQPSIPKLVFSKPLGVTREVATAAREFALFHDPQWSALTIAQIGAASADAATSLNNFRACPTCLETGVSKYFVGEHPDAHKYIVGGAIEISAEAVLAHYFRHHGPKEKLYWRILWAMPQSLSLYEHAQAANHNAALVLNRVPPGSSY